MVTSAKMINGLNTEQLFKTIDDLKEKPSAALFQFHVSNRWRKGTHNVATVKNYYGLGYEDSVGRELEYTIDEPPALLGENAGANPVEFLLVALSGCLTTTLVSLASARSIELKNVESRFEGDLDVQGFLGLSEEVPVGYKSIRVFFKIDSDISKDIKEELLKLAQRYSPVYNSICKSVPVKVILEK
jgi:uncharacterized OsmC-like protein